MLRDLVKDVHTEAENRPFAKLLMSGEISPIQYAEYLYQQEPIYYALEKRADELGMLKDIPNIKRGLKITADFHNLQIAEPFELFQSTKEYCTYVSKISQQQCWAHIYVRHFGDMYGGNMIRKLVPGSATMYEFEDKGKLISYVRDKLTIEMKDEARQVFKYAITLFKELENVYGLE